MHASLRARSPYLPERAIGDFLPRLGWLRENGNLLGLFDADGRLRAYLGGFYIEDFRNDGPSFYVPDWAHGTVPDASGAAGYRYGLASFDDLRRLYKHAMQPWLARGARLHAISIYASSRSALEAFVLCGFGAIVLDAARPTAELLAEPSLKEGSGDFSPRRAGPEDADALAGLNEELAAHIGAPPVCMPRTRGMDSGGWRSWLADPARVAFCAVGQEGEMAGYIKAEAPQEDVSYAVHGPGTLAIDGMYVAPAYRRSGLGRSLLAAVAAHADRAGLPLTSVDHETTNLEAAAFWSRFFDPVTYSLERRIR